MSKVWAIRKTMEEPTGVTAGAARFFANGFQCGATEGASKFLALRRHNSPDIPYLRRVAYLESHGSQLIDTGYVPHGTAYYEIDFMCRTFTGSPEMEAWGTWGAGVNWNCWANKKESTLPLLSGVAAANQRRVYGGMLTGTSGINIGLFSWMKLLHPSTGMLLYGYKVIEGGIPVQDLIPVLDLSGRPAMYDEVSGQLFRNAGTGEFTWGELDAE